MVTRAERVQRNQRTARGTGTETEDNLAVWVVKILNSDLVLPPIPARRASEGVRLPRWRVGLVCDLLPHWTVGVAQRVAPPGPLGVRQRARVALRVPLHACLHLQPERQRGRLAGKRRGDVPRPGRPAAHRPVVAARQELPAVGTEQQAGHLAGVFQRLAQQLAGGRAPEVDKTLAQARAAETDREGPAIGGEGDALHRVWMK